MFCLKYGTKDEDNNAFYIIMDNIKNRGSLYGQIKIGKTVVADVSILQRQRLMVVLRIKRGMYYLHHAFALMSCIL